MTQGRPGGHGRLDRVLAPGYLDGIAQRPLSEVRVLRNDAAQEETDLSFVRRLLHARIDIVLAEQRRRTEGGTDLVGDLATILADNAVAVPAGLGRLPTMEPSRADSHGRYVEALVADFDLSEVSSLPDGKLAEALQAYRTEEAAVSGRRQQVQAIVDSLNAEISARYRAGTATVDELLAEQLHTPPGEERS